MHKTEEEKKAERIEELYNRAVLSIESGQYSYAITLFNSALSINPNFVKALDGIKVAKTKQLQQSGLISQKIKSIFFMIQAFLYEHREKYEKAMDKYESLFALMRPPMVMLPHLGDVYLANEMVESATTAYNAVLQHDPDNIHSLRKLGRIYLDQGQIDEAKSVYDRLSSVGASDQLITKEVHEAYAEITIERGRWQKEGSFRQKVAKETPVEEKETAEKKEEAVTAGGAREQTRALKKRLEKEPYDISLRKELAGLLLDEKHTEEAIAEYRKIADLDPKDIPTHETLASLYQSMGDTPKAVKEYEKLAEVSPDDPDILIRLAGLHREQDAPDKAIEIYKKITELRPDDPDVREALGSLYEQTRYFDEAIQEYENVISLAPQRKEIDESLGNLYLRNGKPAKAIEKFEKVIEQDKMNTGLRKVLADLYTREDLIDKARATYEEILKIDADDTAAKASLQEIEAGELDRKAKQADEQIREYEKTSAAEPDNAETKKKLEEAKLARLDLQIRALEDRTNAQPENAEFHYQLGAAYREKGDVDKALKELQMAVNDEKRSVDSLRLIGLCFEEKKMLDIAAKQLEKASSKLTTMNDTRKAILYDLGRVYEKMGQEQKALDKYKEIYEVDIAYRDVSAKIEKAYK